MVGLLHSESEGYIDSDLQQESRHHSPSDADRRCVRHLQPRCRNDRHSRVLSDWHQIPRGGSIVGLIH